MASILIEGATPNTYLNTGQRRRVEKTQLVRKLLKSGYIVEIKPDPILAPTITITNDSGQDLEVELITQPAEERDDAVAVPARNASKDTWREFLESEGFEVDATATREQMIGAWFD